jgi:phospholipid/cholesterol/gamma-HCH transport system ATP-binding protein
MIELVGLRKAFGSQRVLDGVTLSIRRGETVVVIGRSGTGKSVLLKHLVGLLRPDGGQILLDGENVAEFTPEKWQRARARFGVLFQSAALFDSMPVWENVGLALLEDTRMSRKEIRATVEGKLELVGLTGVSHRMPSDLSGGMKKRVALARAIARDPEIVLYDEPTAGLDPITGDMINLLLVRLRDHLKITAVAVTHDMTSAMKIADRICMLHDGKIVGEATPATIETTDNPYLRQFIRGEAHGPIEVFERDT